MPTLRNYAGACDCRAVRFEAATDLGRVFQCAMQWGGQLALAWDVGVYLRHAFECEPCGSVGWLITYVTDERFKLLAGEVNSHGFCPECGIYAFGHGWAPDRWAINVRCLQGVLADVPASPDGHLVGALYSKVMGRAGAESCGGSA